MATGRSGGGRMISAPSLTVGIEEEYLLVDLDSLELVRETPDRLLSACAEELGEQVAPEFLQCQIEVGTRPHTDVRSAIAELAELRRVISGHARDHGCGIVAASTHPSSTHEETKRTERERYRHLDDDLQAVVRRLLISGMHVHLGIEDSDLRVDFLNQTTYILPHLLALSTSSPFFEGSLTGLKSYRLAVWDELPRTGLPPSFDSYSEYERHVDVLVGAGVIAEATMLWWDLRPSARYPTLEMRISDLCTSIDDAECIATVFRCWCHMLWRLRKRNQRWRNYETMLILENRWRAQRYGVTGSLVDFGRGELVDYGDLVEELIEMLMPDAEELDCVPGLTHMRTIVERGTSADRQLARYDESIGDGASHVEALRDVVSMLLDETLVPPTLEP